MPRRTTIVGLVGALVVGGAFTIVVRQRRRLAAVAAAPDPWAGHTFDTLPPPVGAVIAGDGTELHVVDGGGPGRPIVLVHGLTANHRFWALVSERLMAAGRHVVAYDQRGHASSTLGPAGVSAEALGADLAAVMTCRDLTDAVVVGHSLGGVAVMAGLLRHPEVVADRAAHAVICSSLARQRRDFAFLLDRGIMARLMAHRLPDTLVDLAGLQAFGDGATTSLLDHARSLYDDFDGAAFATGLGPHTNFDLRPGLAHVGTPTTVVCGTRDVVTPPHFSREIIDGIADAAEVWYEGAGHVVPLERVDAFSELLIELSA